jgi:hypothetical protein
MKGDFSRLTFRQDRHYSSVRLQQGRVQLDADWNEQIDIQAHHDRTAARDAVGPRGGPLDKPDSFKLSVVPDDHPADGPLLIGAGRYYVDGILCENETDVGFTVQPDLPKATLPTQAGNYLAYLDVWQRLVTAVEDPAIREVALGGPDTATRTQTVWQVKLQKVDSADDCAEFGKGWKPEDAAFTVKLRAQARSTEGTPDDPCIVPPGAGYTRLENQLYRVEIHDGGEPYGRRSQSTITEIQDLDRPNKKVRVADDGQTWLVDQWVELFEQGSTAPGTLIRITAVDATTRTLTLDSEDLSDVTADRLRRVATFKFSRHNGAILARVEGITDDVVTVSDPGKDPTLGFAEGKCVELSDEGRTLRGEPGVMVERKNVIGNDIEIVWPGAPMTMADFPTRSGGTPPTARRWEGTLPVNTTLSWEDLEDGVQVGFEGELYRSGDYWIIPARSFSGEVQWPQDTNGPSFEPPYGIEHHYCPLAILELADEGPWTVKADCRELFPSLTRLVASKVGYTPGDQVAGLEEVTTVQEAIDELGKTAPGAQGILITDVRTVAPNDTLANDASVPVSALAGGLRVKCDKPVDPASVAGELFPDAVDDSAKTRGKPTCFVTLDMPYPFGDDDKALWGANIVGYRPLILRGSVAVDDQDIVWKPADAMKTWLEETLFEKMAHLDRGDRILAHLTLKGNFIWARDNRSLYLDGDAVSVSETENPVGLDLPSGDGRRGGDFEMWFWLESELFSIREMILDPPPGMVGGLEVPGRVVMHGILTDDIDIELWSSDANAATLRSGDNSGERIRITVQAGQKEAGFTVVTRPVPVTQDVTISAQVVQSSRPPVATDLTVPQPSVFNFNVNPSPIRPGSETRGHVILNGQAPAGMEFDVSSSHDEFVRLVSEEDPEGTNLPGTVPVVEGQSQTEFRLFVSEGISNQDPKVDSIEIALSYRQALQATTTLELV